VTNLFATGQRCGFDGVLLLGTHRGRVAQTGSAGVLGRQRAAGSAIIGASRDDATQMRPTVVCDAARHAAERRWQCVLWAAYFNLLMLKPIHRCCTVVWILTASFAHATDRKPSLAGSHCGPDEQVVFSCRIDHKIASMCASKRFTRDEGHLQYRYGAPGKVEIEVPSRSAADRARITVMRSPPSNANALAVGIQNGGFTYYVFSSESVGSTSDGMRGWVYDSGVEVHKGREPVFSRRCTGRPDDDGFVASLFQDAAVAVETSAQAWEFGGNDRRRSPPPERTTR